MKIKIASCFLLVIILCSVVLFSACQNNLSVKEQPNEVGLSLFETNNRNDIKVFFFDDDNVVSDDGNDFTPLEITLGANSIKSSDCYMIQSGDCEILVDAGHQLPSVGEAAISSINNHLNNEKLQNDVKANLLRKIATVISNDGVLDYLIVTHADFDHIASLIITGGIFDAFLKGITVTDLNGRNVKFEKINHIIDFDSGLVRHYSDEYLDKSARLISSNTYQAYVLQRDNLIEKGTDYCPAAAFFDYETLNKVNPNLNEEIKASLDDKITVAMPEEVLDRYNKASAANPSLDFYILDETKQSNGEVNKHAKNNSDFSDSELLKPENGKLVAKNSRYYYSLKFNKGELRILYNWHYDYIFRSNFNQKLDPDTSQDKDVRDESFDSQDANNISVCFEVVKDNFKFLSLGDLGGNGEDGLLKYYKDTNVLSRVSLFKASHHGSTVNKENSGALFKVTKPRIIVVTGCAQVKPLFSTDLVLASRAMTGTTKVTQDFFNNIYNSYSANESLPYILFTNINSYSFDTSGHFRSPPFYGDIKVRYDNLRLHLSYSYAGNIKGYIKQDTDQCQFTTRSNKNEFLSCYQTEWFKQIGLTWGK